MKWRMWEKIILVAVITAALFFRTYQIEGKLTFEWDQSRDYSEARKIVEKGQLPLLGPIVRGDIGGFYLGPLYYYLVTPLYYFSAGNPLALSVISISLDMVVIILLYALLRSKLSRMSAFIAIIIWACSPLIIHDSFTPWNVSLISVWMVLFLTTLTNLTQAGRFRYKFIAIFLISLISDIHLSLVPVALVLLLANYKSFLKLTLRQYGWLLVALILPLSPLIWHDLTHDLQNLRLLKQFLLTVTDKSGSIAAITTLVMQKFGYTVGRLFTGEPYTAFGLSITSLVSLIGLLNKKNRSLAHFCLLTIVSVLSALIYYHDFDFAEYYFLPTYIPLIILVSMMLDSMVKLLPRYLSYLLVVVLIATYLGLGNRVRLEPISPYSLTIKKEVVHAIKNLDYPVEITTILPRERDTAFPYLMQNLGVSSDNAALRKAYIYESKNLEVIAPEDARSIILDMPIQAFKLVVFSN